MSEPDTGPPPPAIKRCRVCGCTDTTPCPGGCSWVLDDLCSNQRCLFQAQVAEMEKHADARVPIEFDVLTAIQCVAALQLALRHPRIPQTAGTTSRIIVDAIGNRLRQISPLFGILIDMGNDAKFDSPADESAILRPDGRRARG